jgi:hypothetical protein
VFKRHYIDACRFSKRYFATIGLSVVNTRKAHYTTRRARPKACSERWGRVRNISPQHTRLMVD